MSTHIEQTSWGGWPNCYRLSNDEIELILTSDVGPRVIRCGFVGGPNVFKEYAEELGGTGEGTWKIRGGHRVWVAPERANITYELDNHTSTSRSTCTRWKPLRPSTLAPACKRPSS